MKCLSKKLNLGYLLLSFLLLMTSVGLGQVDLKATPFEIDGLFQESDGVRFVKTDSKDQLWVVLGNGFAIYDGKSYKIFEYDSKDTLGLHDPSVLFVFEGRNEKVWLGTLNGISLFNPRTEQFKTYLTEDNRHGNIITAILEDKSGNLWVGGQQGLFKYNYEKDSFEKAKILEDANEESLFVFNLEQWSNEKILMQTSKGLLFLSPDKMITETANFIGLPDISFGLLSNDKMLKDENGDFWFGDGNGGLVHINRKSNVVETFKLPISDNVLAQSRRVGFSLSLFPENKIIIHLFHAPNLMFDPVEKEFHAIYVNRGHEEREGSILTGPFFVDNEQNIWIPSNRENQFLFRSNLSNLKIQQIELLNMGGYLTSIFKTRNGKVWYFDKMNRFLAFDSETTIYEEFDLSEELGERRITFIIQDDNGTFWLAASDPGEDFISSRFYRYSKGELLDISNQRETNFYIMTMAIDKFGRIWLGTNSGQLGKEPIIEIYDPESQKSQSISYLKSQEEDINLIYDIFKDKDGTIWVGTNTGLYLFDYETQMFSNFNFKSHSISNFIHYIYQTSDDLIWLSTMDGLIFFNPKSEKGVDFQVFTKKEGLTHNYVMGLVEDDRQNLWISTRNGLTKMNLKSYTFQNYSLKDGFLSSKFYKYFLKDETTGHLFLRSYNGLNIFHPDSLRKNTYIPPVQFTHFEYFSSDGQNTSNHEIKGIGYKDQITLKHGQNNFSCRFAALSYRNPSKNQYAYQLVGVDKNWVQIGNKHELTFSNLAPGRYTLRVKGSNNDGVWNEEGAALQILILPPWWWSLWAKMGYGLLGAALLFSLYRYQLKRKLSLEEAKRLKEMDQVKTKLFTNITHEFRTPLTVIQGTAEQEISQKGRIKAEDNLQNARTIQRNSAQLLTLVNQLLDLRKLESGQLPVHWVQDDIIQYLKYLTESFHSHAENKGLQLHFLSEIDQLQMDYDPDKLLYVVSNLLSNAVKFTPSGGNVYFQVARDSTNDHLILKVKDTGIGIEEAKLPKVFDRFYQVDDSAVRKQEGSGIGLSLTKELVNLMGGRISVSSQLGKGSLFTVELPITQKAYKQTVSVDDLNRKTLGFATAPVLANGQKEKKEATSDLPLVLIIEDNPDVVRYLTSCLDQQYNILTAQNGQIGIHTALDMVPDLIISDVMMPEKDGFEVCQILKEDERTSHIPIILLTAKADVSSKLKGLQYGADAYLSKPFHREELDIRIEQLIELRKKLQERFGSLDFEQFNVQRNSPEEAFLLKVRQVVEENMSNSNFGMAQLCRAIGLSRSQLFRKLKALTGKSTSLVVRSIKLQKARHLLKTTDMTVTEIAYETGFSDLAYFSKCFVEEYGENPSAVKNS
jgi:signal transduction histidine kinase/DNA-binding response OmpR family regulator/ligand-binding sensor domain-containing protein